MLLFFLLLSDFDNKIVKFDTNAVMYVFANAALTQSYVRTEFTTAAKLNIGVAR